MICRRLGHTELKEWIELAYSGTIIEADLMDDARNLANLETSIIYIASIEDKIVGGTWLWRDKPRLSLTLADVWMQPEVRPKALTQLVKSSLPWFKSLAIRQVDTLVFNQNPRFSLPFHHNPVLNNWMKEILLKNGFTEGKQYYQETYGLERRIGKSTPLIYQRGSDVSWVRKTLWEKRKELDYDLSPPSMILEYGNTLNHLHTFSINETPVFATTIQHYKDTAVIGPIVSDSVTIDDSFVIETLLSQIPINSSKICFSFLSENQCNLVHSTYISEKQSESEMIVLSRMY